MHNVFCGEKVHNLLVSLSKKGKLESFFNSAAALMTLQLQKLTLNSLSDYTRLISKDMVGGHSKALDQFILEIDHIRLENIVVVFLTLYPMLQHSERARGTSGFVLHLILEDADIKFEPDLRTYEEALVSVIELMLRSTSGLPRVETTLFPDWVRQKSYGQVIRTDAISYDDLLMASFKIKCLSYSLKYSKNNLLIKMLLILYLEEMV